jgi:hypothetical protein
VQGRNTKAGHFLVSQTLENLVELHNLPVDMLCRKLVNYYAYKWHNYISARGAFAFFEPGQFCQLEGYSMFASIIAPAAGGPGNSTLPVRQRRCIMHRFLVYSARPGERCTICCLVILGEKR